MELLLNEYRMGLGWAVRDLCKEEATDTLLAYYLRGKIEAYEGIIMKLERLVGAN